MLNICKHGRLSKTWIVRDAAKVGDLGERGGRGGHWRSVDYVGGI